MLKQKGAILINDHFVYSSGHHGDSYVDKDRLFQDPQSTFALSLGIAELIAPRNLEVVVGPQLGGVALALFVGYHLSNIYGKIVNVVFAEKINGGQAYSIRQSYIEVLTDRRAAIVEDVINTGATVAKVAAAVYKYTRTIVCVGALCNRNIQVFRHIAGVSPVLTLSHIKFQTYEGRNCALCRRDIPVNTSIGRGKQFLDQLERAAAMQS